MIAELSINLGPQIQIAQEALTQYAPFIATFGIITLGGLKQFFTRNNEVDVETAIAEVADDIVLYTSGKAAYFTGRDADIRLDICDRSAKGIEKVNQPLNARRGEAKGSHTYLRIFPHGHTTDESTRQHIPLRRGGLFSFSRQKPPSFDDDQRNTNR